MVRRLSDFSRPPSPRSPHQLRSGSSSTTSIVRPFVSSRRPRHPHRPVSSDIYFRLSRRSARNTTFHQPDPAATHPPHQHAASPCVLLSFVSPRLDQERKPGGERRECGRKMLSHIRNYEHPRRLTLHRFTMAGHLIPLRCALDRLLLRGGLGGVCSLLRTAGS